jgi:glucose-1-phosphate cytidylyltransferase
MKVVLLAGGFGTRISEESRFKPKPMIEIGVCRFSGIL